MYVGIRVCVCVFEVCQRNQSDKSVKSLPLGWREEGKGREGKWDGKREGV